MRLDDIRWRALEGGRREPYDASDDLKALASGEDDALSRLWDQLHHQGDVGLASYAAVPALVEIYTTRMRDGNFYGLINTIEICRHKNNPELPSWLAQEYHAALSDVLTFAIQDVRNHVDSPTLQQMLAAIAVAKGNLKIGEFLSDTASDEIDAILAKAFEWTS